MKNLTHSPEGRHWAYVEMSPPDDYRGKHAADVRGYCAVEGCVSRCSTCGLHMCQCTPKDR